MKRDADGVVGVDVGGDAEDHWLLFGFVCTEQNVPKDEDSTIVLIDVLSVAAMMNTMCRRGDEDVFEESEFANVLGMRQNAPDQTDNAYYYHHLRVEAQPWQIEIEQRAQNGRKHRLPKGGGEIVLRAGMMVHMIGPKEPHTM